MDTAAPQSAGTAEPGFGDQPAAAPLRWETGAESVLTHGHHAGDLPAEIARWYTITQI
jgi:hypothetical protein